VLGAANEASCGGQRLVVSWGLNLFNMLNEFLNNAKSG